MGRATRWLKALLGIKREKFTTETRISDDQKEKKRWSFTKSTKEHSPSSSLRADASTAWLRSYMSETQKDQTNHAIAIAAAHAAVAAAQAAVAVISLTTLTANPERRAAVKIQSVFRGFLARKARRALKGLVKLQALVRGFLIRKRASAMLHSMRAMIRAQTAARLQRSSRLLPRKSLDRFDDIRSEIHSKRLSTWFEDLDDSPRTIEIDIYKQKLRSRKIAIEEWNFTDNESWQSTAMSTPRLAGFPMERGFIPAKRLLRRDADFPNYMTNTQSFRAKLRSRSAPKQRLEKLSVEEIMASRNSISNSSTRIHRSCPRVL